MKPTTRTASSRRWGGLSRERLAVLVALLAITLGGLAMRLYRLDGPAFWNDEALQLNGMNQPLHELRAKHLQKIDFMPPLSYAIQRVFWLKTKTHFAARLPSALFGTLMIPLAFLSVRRLTDDTGGLVAAFLTATSLFLVWYSQECRAYIFWAVAMWAVLHLWLCLLVAPWPGNVASRVLWGALFLTGCVCGGLHFGTLMFLPFAGVAGAGLLLCQHFATPRTDRRWGPLLQRLGLLAACLGAAEAVSYAILKWSVSLESFKAQGHVTGGYRPDPSAAAALLLKYTWGRGWRLVPFAALLLAGLVPLNRRRACYTGGAVLLLAATCVTTFYIHPSFPDRNKLIDASRYLFWNEWVVLLLLSLGAHAIMTRCRGPRGRMAVAAGLLAVYAGVQWGPFRCYYRMDAKAANYGAVRRIVEGVPGRRLFALGNTYDMQYMRHHWPTNCLAAAAPIFNTRKDFELLRLDDWVVQAADTYPDMVMMIKWRRNFADATVSNLATRFECHPLVTNGTEMALYDLGLHPNETSLQPPHGHPMFVFYNREEDLAALAARRGAPLALFPPELSMLNTRDERLAYHFWRGLDRRADLSIVLAGDRPRAAEVRVPAAATQDDVEIFVSAAGQPTKLCRVEKANTDVLDVKALRWVSQPLRLQDLRRTAHRVPMRIRTTDLVARVTLAPGRNTVTLKPRVGSCLLGPPVVTFAD